MPATVLASDLNDVFAASQARVDQLEQKLADIIQPILAEAGRKAVANFRAHVTDHMTAAALVAAAGQAPGVTPTLTMVCVKPRPAEASAVAVDGGIAPEFLHVTLASLGEIDGPLADVVDALRPVAASLAPLSGSVAGGGFFGRPNTDGPIILLPDVRGLVELRDAVAEALVEDGIEYARDHGFTPHMTVAYRDGEDAEETYDPFGEPLHFDALYIVRGDVVEYELPLVGVPALTAAAGPPSWSAPFPDQIVDVDALTAQIRANTDPVRTAMVKATMTPALQKAGLNFSVTNPLTAKVLASAGAKVRGIAETTQLNVMRTIRSAYDNGLSIPQTAEAIQAGMSSASLTRATMIARTELAGAANGGALAAGSLVSDATGSGYQKKWLTAPGAPHPRHEEYDGLDGQTVALDEYFDVGGAQLQYPGDPDGDPGETINCFPYEIDVAMPGLRAATRRWYDGDLVRVRTASGDDLAGTPNHPVLRSDGTWVPLGEVREGDDLVRAEFVWDYRGAPDPDRRPAMIGEVYRLAEMVADPERVGVAPPDLHGNGADGQVDVVTVDGSLLADGEAASDEDVEEFGLALAAGARAAEGSRDHPALGESWFRYLNGAYASRFVRGPREGTAMVYPETTHALSVRLRTAADRKPQLVQAERDGGTPHAESGRDSKHGLPVLVAPTKVVKVDREPFHGYVFTLDTGEGWFTASSLVCRNCRCTLVMDEGGTEEEFDADSPPDLGESFSGSSDMPPVGDTISTNTAPFVNPTVVDRIKEKHLDLPVAEGKPTTEFGRDVYANAAGKGTEGLYSDGAGNWTPERQQLHQDILGRIFAGKDESLAEGEVPRAYFTSGGGASGKSSATFDIHGTEMTVGQFEDLEAAGTAPTDIVRINPDSIKEMLPEYVALGEKGDLYAASGVHDESSALAKEALAEAQRRGISIIYDSTGSSNSFIRALDKAKELGYETHVTMVSAPTNGAIERAMARGDRLVAKGKVGRYVNVDALKSAHKNSSAIMDVWRNSPSVDRWKIIENSGVRPLVVAEKKLGGDAVYHDKATFDKVLAKKDEQSFPDNVARFEPKYDGGNGR